MIGTLRPHLKPWYAAFLILWFALTLAMLWLFATGRGQPASFFGAVAGMLATVGLFYTAPPSSDPFEIVVFLWLWAPLLAAPFGLFERIYPE